ncbi:hypothetical protein NV63_17545 [Elizabethkingia anophelis]|nr:hypothetical protein NV63_17545 [Elizabethkingia anophelis]
MKTFYLKASDGCFLFFYLYTSVFFIQRKNTFTAKQQLKMKVLEATPKDIPLIQDLAKRSWEMAYSKNSQPRANQLYDGRDVF